MSSEVMNKLHMLEAMVSGDPAHLSKLIHRIIRDELAAQDLSQDTLLRAVRGLPDFRGEAEANQLCPWLNQIARHLAYNYIRDCGRRPSQDSLDVERSDGETLAAHLPIVEADPALIASQAETHASLVKMIQTLSPEIRAVFLLRVIEGLSTAETATTLGVNEDLVKWRLRRARALLRNQLPM